MACPSMYVLHTQTTMSTLCSNPWKVVEMNRLLTGLIQVIQEVDTNTGLPLCNEHSCPTMSAGR